jgi:acyl-coenzyme A synthetase/AMP-(fatty) acid ligase
MVVPLSRFITAGPVREAAIAFRGPRSLGFAEFRASVLHVAREIATRRVRRGLLVCEDSYWFMVGLLGLLHGGAEVVLPSNSQIGTIDALRGDFDLLVGDVPLATGASQMRLGESGSEGGGATLDAAATRIDFFTSGSTGAPKRVAKTLAMLEDEAGALDRAWGAALGDARVFGMVSHQHIFGLAFKVLWPLMTGRSFAAEVHHVWEALLDQLPPGAAIVSSPAHLTRLGGIDPLPPSRRPRLVFTAGAPLPPPAAEEVRAILGQEPVEIFGSTETGAVAWRRGVETTFWRTLPGVTVGATEQGLLRVSSPYAGAGWCELADRAEIRSATEFHLLGRADRVAKVEGKRVSLPQLEQQIARLPWVAEAAVAPIEEERLFLGAVIVLSAEGRAELEKRGKFRFERQLRHELAATQDPAVLPRRWRFVEQLPTDAMGKRRRRELAALLEPVR